MVVRRPAGPRVVLLPGTLGSVLADQSLTPEQAGEACRRNLGPDRDRRWRGQPWYPCDQRPQTLWGAVGTNRHNALVVERRIVQRWYHGDPPPRERPRPEEERITFIGHSMGGLVARCLLESRPLGPVSSR